jgi:hypothetical protein
MLAGGEISTCYGNPARPIELLLQLADQGAPSGRPRSHARQIVAGMTQDPRRRAAWS